MRTDFPAPATIRKILKGRTYSWTKETTRMCSVFPISERLRSQELSPSTFSDEPLLCFMSCIEAARRKPFANLSLIFFLEKSRCRFSVVPRYTNQRWFTGWGLREAERESHCKGRFISFQF